MVHLSLHGLCQPRMLAQSCFRAMTPPFSAVISCLVPNGGKLRLDFTFLEFLDL
jgi:hypothetical protein